MDASYSNNSGGNSARSKKTSPRYRTVGSGSEVDQELFGSSVASSSLSSTGSKKPPR